LTFIRFCIIIDADLQKWLESAKHRSQVRGYLSAKLSVNIYKKVAVGGNASPRDF